MRVFDISKYAKGCMSDITYVVPGCPTDSGVAVTITCFVRLQHTQTPITGTS